MRLPSPLNPSVLALLPALAIAQAENPRPDPMNAAHAVPQAVYRSEFTRYQDGKAQDRDTPDRRWTGINRALMPQDKPAARSTMTGQGAPEQPAAPVHPPAAH